MLSSMIFFFFLFTDFHPLSPSFPYLDMLMADSKSEDKWELLVCIFYSMFLTIAYRWWTYMSLMFKLGWFLLQVSCVSWFCCKVSHKRTTSTPHCSRNAEGTATMYFQMTLFLNWVFMKFGEMKYIFCLKTGCNFE